MLIRELLLKGRARLFSFSRESRGGGGEKPKLVLRPEKKSRRL